ncbi:MAG: xanthine dehydrogenase family protein molybdopterin-binding subunit, partial [Dehalococcoidia bacterium]
MATANRILGKRLPQHDSIEKATGHLTYTADVMLPGTLVGKFLFSPHPHARIVSIDTSKAEAIPGVRGVITWRDLPDKRAATRTAFAAYVLARDKVRYAGEAVAAVVGVDEDTAQRAVDAIQVDYEELPAVFEPHEAMKPGAPVVFEGDELPKASPGQRFFLYPFSAPRNEGPNVDTHFRLRTGDVHQGFEEADVILEETYYYPMVYQSTLENSAVVARTKPSGDIEVWLASQGASWVQTELARFFDVPMERVSVHGMR